MAGTRGRPRQGQVHPIDDVKSIEGALAAGPSYHTNGGKRYVSANPNEGQRFDFEIQVYRNNVPEVHGFTAIPTVDLGAVLLYTTSDDAAGQAMLRLLRVNLADDDGVPNDWEPTLIERPRNAGPGWQPKFRAPRPPHGDGKLHELTEAWKWTDRDAGSSRRRFTALMFEDEGVSVTIDVLQEILKDLMERATGGTPTSGS